VIDTALAQSGAGGGPPAMISFLPLILVFGVFYFLLIRPQQQKAKQHEAVLEALKRNDEIVTGGGLYGKVVAINDDVVTVELAPKIQVRVSRPTIALVLSAEKEKNKTKDKAK
jgi:preprotein translocase subunit YajC